ncbi:MAG TPA: DMT family transporter [Patescibacteria group bacterium]|nr:DMT family transporter [Patescibacteria group bacterium]
MSRLQADLVLLLVALIWGAAFVAQKEAMEHVGPYTFIAARFGISALLVLPLALREQSRGARLGRSAARDLGFLCVAFCAGVIFQQAGVALTSVTNAGFLTGLYVLFTAVICAVIYRQKLSRLVIPAALMSVAGVGLLSGGYDLARINVGDTLVLCCAVGFGFQVALVGRVMDKWPAPFRVCFIQYASVTFIAGLAALVIEQASLANILNAGWPILYAGAISGGIAYTLQVVAQRFTPASDAAVIMSAESLFAALFGALLMSEKLTLAGGIGCALIISAILLVEFAPYLRRKLVQPHPSN